MDESDPFELPMEAFERAGRREMVVALHEGRTIE